MNQLTLESNYQTPERKIHYLARKFPAWFFYGKMVKTVFHASHIAKKGKFNSEVFVDASLEIVSHLESVGARFIVEYMDRFKQLDGPCVFVGNHMSTLETFALPCIITPFKKVNFVVKESLYNYPVFKHVMHALQPIRVSRVNPREDLKTMMEEGLKQLSAGVSVIVFPQTTRQPRFDASGFNSIGTKLASRANVPVVPVAVRTDAWGNGKKIKDFGAICPKRTIRFAFGNPIEVIGNGKEAQAEVVSFIETHVNQWFSEDE